MSRFEDAFERSVTVPSFRLDLALDSGNDKASIARTALSDATQALTVAGMLPNLDIFEVQQRSPAENRNAPAGSPPDAPTRMLRPSDAPAQYDARTRQPITSPRDAEMPARRTPDSTNMTSWGMVTEYWNAPGYSYDGGSGVRATRFTHADGSVAYVEYARGGLSQGQAFYAEVLSDPPWGGEGVVLEAREGTSGMRITTKPGASGTAEYFRADRVNGRWLSPQPVSADLVRTERERYRRLITR